MRIAVVTPTKGDRAKFLGELYKTIKRQTIQPDIHIVVDDVHESDYPDVTWRYKLGIQRAKDAYADVILFMEDDDWYSDTYIQQMCSMWKDAGKPQLLGLDTTIYYHIGLEKYVVLYHSGRASMMSTMITPELVIPEHPNTNPSIDIRLWDATPAHRKRTITPSTILCVGIKHNLSSTAGVGHSTLNRMYKNSIDDVGLVQLKEIVGSRAVKFYKRIAKGTTG